MKKLATLILIILNLGSCHSDYPNLPKGELKIINDVFPAVIDSVALPYYLSYVVNDSVFKLVTYKVIDKSFDSLCKEKFVVSLIPTMRQVENYKVIFLPTLKKLPVSGIEKFNPLTINVKDGFVILKERIKNTGRYILIYGNEKDKSLISKSIGEVTFSRVTYDPGLGIGYFYVDFEGISKILPTYKHYMGYKIFVQKKDGKWHIIKTSLAEHS